MSTTGINDTINFKLVEKINSLYKFKVTHFSTPGTVYGYWFISDTEFAFSNDSLGNDKQTLLNQMQQ